VPVGKAVCGHQLAGEGVGVFENHRCLRCHSFLNWRRGKVQRGFRRRARI
jgi:hypothetical protein